MNPIEFQKKWLANTLKERSASQPHFLDVCALVNHPTPSDLDGKGEFFTFERGATKLRGGQGWADVWYQNRFAWEYKGPGKDLKAAYDQLAQYREDLENPPLLIVSDLDRIEIHINFTGTVKRVYEIDLSNITEPESLRVLTAAFFTPEALKPDVTIQQVTEQASRQFGALATGLRARGAEPREAAHFLMQLLVCRFPNDVNLLLNAILFRRPIAPAPLQFG
ncbi:MAG: type IIL restriction-modification enzyme MmeI [Thermomicrobiales bacterium]